VCSSDLFQGFMITFMTLLLIFAVVSTEAIRMSLSQGEMKKIAVNGTELAYIEMGSGDPLIFVHGSVGDYRSFSPQFEAFAQRYRIISYSRRFHPPNSWTDEDPVYAPALHADDLAALIETLGLTRPHIVAASYGGYCAVMLAARSPGLFRSMVLGEPPILPLLKNSEAGRQALSEFEENALKPSQEAYLKGDLEDGLRKFMDGILGRKGAFDQIPQIQRKELLKFAPEMKLEMLADPKHYLPTPTMAQIAKIDIPVLLVCGDRSPKMFGIIADELERAFPNRTRITIPNAGHSMHAGNSDTYNREVLEFLNICPAL
jgi:non-heme chloroperoxidase